MQDTRALISRFIREYPGSKPAQIADALQLKAPTVRQTCKRMADDGQIRAASGGAYFPNNPSDSREAHQASQLSLRHSTAFDQGEQQ